MPEDNGICAKAKLFFEKADEAAANYNFDYAIDLYLQGLRCNPDALQDGHLQLRELALRRQAKGGKKPSIMERMKYSRGKNPLEQLLNAEYLMARDPEHLPYIEAMLKAAVAGGYNQTAKWIADLLFAANNASQSPSAHAYLLLKDSYAAIGLWDRALAACQYAAKLRPDDGEIADEAKRLSAELTVSRGKYDQAGDFRKSIKNREEQEVFQSQQGVVKSNDYRVLAVEAARKTYEQNPESAHSIFGLAGVLADMRTDQAEEEAIKLLDDAYKKRQDFSFKERAGLIRIGQVKRKIREADEVIDANPEDSVAKSKHAGLIAQLNKAEMEHYGLCVKNYPTDLKAKYEYYQPRLEMWIPLLFWHNLLPANALSNRMIQWGQRTITVKLAAIQSIISARAAGNTGRIPIPQNILDQIKIENMELYTNCLFTSADIHDVYMKEIGFTMIRTHHRVKQQITNPNGNILLQGLKHATEFIYVGFQPRVNETPEKWTDMVLLQENTFQIPVVQGGNLAVGTAIYKNKIIPIQNLGLTSSGVVIYNSNHYQFYEDFLPFSRGNTAVLMRGAFLIPFNLKTGELQPTGYMNLDRARETYLNWTGGLFSETAPAMLYVCGMSINFLIVKDGKACITL